MKKVVIKNGSEKETKKKSGSEIKSLVNDLNKKFGTNAVQVGFHKNQEIGDMGVKKIPTNIKALDIALGGGAPLGRFTHIAGAFSSSKTTMALHIVREFQKAGYTCAIFDAEGTLTPDYLIKLGIDLSKLIYSRPDGLEECTQAILDCQKSGLVQLVLWDSIEASPPNRELELNIDETIQLGIKQKLLGSFCRKYQANNNRLVREGGTPLTLIGLNQLREGMTKYGDPEFIPGGRALGFTSTVEIRLRRADWIKEGKGENAVIVGQVVKFLVRKNKLYINMQNGEMDFYFSSNNESKTNEGYYDNFKSIVIEAIDWGIIRRGGAWYYITDELKFQGLESLVEYLRENPILVDDLMEKVLSLAKKG